jgi:hypothetical protein
MESCRSGSDDLSDPQFADLAARLAEDPELRVQFPRIQMADAAIKAAFPDVPVPAGLANRVSQRLAESAAGSRERGAVSRDADPVAVLAKTAPDSVTPLEKPEKRVSRRRLLVGFAALSAASALLAAVWIQTHPSRHDSPNKVLDEAMDFFGNDTQPFGAGELVSRAKPPAEYPLGRDVELSQDIRWRRVEKFLGGPALAYDFDLRVIGGRATLYVLNRNVPDLPSFPPNRPNSSTGGNSAAAWQVGNTLYVLVVEGDAGMYSRCLDHSHGPLT